MEEIEFKDWRLNASAADADMLKLDVEALDGTDIIEVGYTGHGAARGGDIYSLHFTTEKIEEVHNRPLRDGRYTEPQEDPTETARGDWSADEADEDETLYVRGWEVTAFVDEEGMLVVEVQKGEDTEIFEVEPIESGIPLSARVIIRLEAQEAVDDDEAEEEEGDYEEDSDVDEFDDYEEADEGDEYEDDLEDEYDEAGSFSLYDDLFDSRRDEDWY